MAVRAALVTAVLLLAAGTAVGSLVVRQDVQTDVANQAAPATLAAGDTGTTTLGSSLTAATTDVAALSILTAQNVLDIDRGGDDWAVRVEAQSITGFGALDSATVRLTDGTSTETQVTVAAGVLTQATGTALDLLATASTLEITASAAKSSLSDNVIEMEIVLTGTAGSPVLRYPYTLTIT